MLAIAAYVLIFSVASQKKMPSRRSTKLQLKIDHNGQSLIADGSDFIVVTAEVTDDSGNVKRLAKDNLFFTVEGEGKIIGDAQIGANPRAVEFGSAPVLIRSTKTPGKIKVNVRMLYEGAHSATPAEIEFESISSAHSFVYLEEEGGKNLKSSQTQTNKSGQPLTDEEIKKALDEVEKQQTDFGIQK